MGNLPKTTCGIVSSSVLPFYLPARLGKMAFMALEHVIGLQFWHDLGK
jgi:hypothetical protein